MHRFLVTNCATFQKKFHAMQLLASCFATQYILSYFILPLYIIIVPSFEEILLSFYEIDSH